MVGGVTCPNCGKDNPDFLDNCQFCQAVLRSESALSIGENPTKKVTGDLEPILPDWLREARQQGRDSAEEDAKQDATKPKAQKEEPPDLLAGLAFQAASDEDEVPDWLAAINPVEKKTPAPSKPVEAEPEDFFAQFNQPVKETAMPTPGETTPSETPSWMSGSADETQKDELTGWLPQASGQQDEPFSFDSGASQGTDAWMSDLGAPVSQEPAKPAEPEDLGWLHDLESSANQAAASDAPQADMGWMANLDSSSTSSTGSQDDLSWLNNLGGTPAPSFDVPTPAQPSSSQEDLSWLNNLGSTTTPSFETPTPAQPASTNEDLDWLSTLGGTPAPSFDAPTSAQPASSQEDLDWLNNLGSTTAPSFETPTPAQPASTNEDLDWLSNLGSTPTPSFDEPIPAQPASSQEDLDWLNNLGSTTAPSFETPTPAQPASTNEDLDWLSNLGSTPTPSFEEPVPAQPAPTSQEDLDWLSNLGGASTPSFEEPAPAQPAPTSQEDLDWLSNLGGTSTPSFEEPAPAQPASSQEDLDWLNTLGGTPTPSFGEPVSSQPVSSQPGLDWLNNLSDSSVPSNEPAPAPFADTGQLKNIESPAIPPSSPFTPRRTAPLSEEFAQEMPDWLKSATEGSSMPPLGATSMDWFASKDKSAEVDDAQSGLSAPQAADQTQGMPASVDQNSFAAASDSSPLSNQDVDSLFAVEMPDWLSQPESAAGDSSTPGGIPSEPGDTLSPVNLPSWVQAMRPVESVIDDVSAASADQNTEKEGPLAGLRGVIPFAPIGSAQRPKTISLKLQATEEQQTSAALLEQILASETTAHALKATPFVVSQRVLRWALTGIFMIVLGVMVGLGSQRMPILISTLQMAEISNMAQTIQSIPESAPLLVVIDYEPALAGEMEAAAGPLLDQIVVARRSNLTFISTSPNGSGLVERLLTNTKINQPAPDGLGYQLNSQYFNVGYLPGGSAGVRGFIEQAKVIMPSVKVNLFSDFAAVIVITDHAESGLVWIEQLELMKQTNPALADQPLLVVASAQAGPLLQPYVSSKQVDGMVNGLSDAARYEFMNNSRPGISRSYWDAFGVGLAMAVFSIVLGSLWSLFTGIRARRAEAEQG